MLKKYSEMLVNTADNMALTFDSTLNLMQPSSSFADAVDLITGACTFSLPVILHKEFRTISKPSSNIWIKRLENQIKIELMKVSSIEYTVLDGIAYLKLDQFRIGVTLVPLFEAMDYGWHVVSVESQYCKSETIQKALVIDMQLRFNRLPISETVSLLDSLKTYLSIYTLTNFMVRLKEGLLRLKIYEFPNLELIILNPTKYVVRPWADGPKWTIYLNEDGSAISSETSHEALSLNGFEDVNSISKDTLTCLVDRVCLQKLEDLRQALFINSWIMFNEEQIKIFGLEMDITMPIDSIKVSVNRVEGKLCVFGNNELTRMLTEESFNSFNRSIKSLRDKQIMSILRSQIDVSDMICLLDADTLASPELGPHQFIFGLKNLYSALLIMNVTDTCGLYLAIEDRMSGRYSIKSIGNYPLPTSLSQWTVDIVKCAVISVFPKFIEQTLAWRKVDYTVADSSTLNLLNYSSLPHIQSVHAKLEEGSKVLCQVDLKADFDPNFIQTDLQQRIVIAPEEPRIDFNRLLVTLEGFMTLLSISKQLEIREAKHRLSLTHLDLVHIKAGLVRIFIDESVSDLELPLNVSCSTSTITPENLELIKGQLRSSANILTIVDYINKISG